MEIRNQQNKRVWNEFKRWFKRKWIEEFKNLRRIKI